MATKAAKQEYKRERLLEMIEQRARAAELDPQVVIRVAELESSLRPSARNRRSTATGLFQLTDARRRELGLPPKKVLSVEEDIEYGVRSLAEARDYLKNRLGREPEPFELYAAHFSGPKRSVDVLSAADETPVDRIYSRVAMRSNPELRGLTAGQVRGRWQERFGDVGKRPAPVPKKEFVPGPPLTLPEMEREAALQLFAQAPVQEPTAMEPVMMASGGLVGESEEITRLIGMARSDADYRRINEMLSGARPAAQFNEGGEAKSEKSAREMLAEMEPTAEELERASKAAFGVVPSSGKGRKAGAVTRALQSGEAQKEAAKGATLLPQNVVGFPVDVAAMLMRPLGYNVEKPVGGSDWLKEKSRQAGLAFPEPTDPTLRAFYTAGDIASNLVNPAGATRTAAKGVEKTGQAAKALAEIATRPVERDPMLSGRMGSQRGAVKVKGGNWIPGNIKYSTAELKPFGDSEDAELLARATPQDKAITDWIDKKLNRYIRDEMGTPEDPVRELAERGILHVDPAVIQAALHSPELAEARALSYGHKLYGKSDAAKIWEAMADEMLSVPTAGQFRNPSPSGWVDRHQKTNIELAFERDPYLSKLPDEARVAYVNDPVDFNTGLGFDHLVDVLNQEMAAGRLTPEQLGRMSMKDAVQRAHQHNLEAAKRMADTNATLRADLPVFKDYGDKGFRWVELNKPGAFASESDAMGHSVRGYEPPKGHPDWVEASKDSGYSNYGLGGWEAIKSGKVKIYSLEDAKGNPHATIEVGNVGHPIGYNDVNQNFLLVNGRQGQRYVPFPAKFEYRTPIEGMADWGDAGVKRPLTAEEQAKIYARARAVYADAASAYLTRPVTNFLDQGLPPVMDAFQQAADEVLGPAGFYIRQIKGKQNVPPDKKYLPYVQDFVKGQPWIDVRDFSNTGLVKIEPSSDLAKALSAQNKPVPKFVTQEELSGLLKEANLPEGMYNEGRMNYNKGGEVSRSTAKDDLGEFMDRAVADRVRGAAESPQYGELVEFLADRRSMPPIKYKPGIRGEFESNTVFGNTLPRTGVINVGMQSDPNTIVHELTHAADKQITQQYYETRRKKNPSDIEKQFVRAFEKLVFTPEKPHSDPARNRRTAMAFKLDPAWAVEQREYRSNPDELVAFGMGSTLRSNTYINPAPLHVDPTMATEFSTLLDLAKRLQKSKPIKDKR